MSLPVSSFLGALGFSENPFALTNADEEPQLQSYFVPPPYFSSVMGNPERPKSSVVFAPRGGGKTAQKVMIEKAAQSVAVGRFICITYDTFILPDGFRLQSATADWHLRNVVRRWVVALMLLIDENPENKKALSETQKNDLAKLAHTFLSGLSASQFKDSISSLRNWKGKAEFVWNKYGRTIDNLVSAIAAKYSLGAINLSGTASSPSRAEVMDHIEHLTSFSRMLGYEAIYILVDRVDETSLTASNASSTFAFIKSLLADLQVLEMRHVAFKFFLWDQLAKYYNESGARPDRVPIHELDWKAPQLSEMLSKRLLAFSNGAVSSLNQFFRPNTTLDAHMLVCYLAAGSPRDMIRYCARVVDEQTRVADAAGLADDDVLEVAIRQFSGERANELFPQFVNDLKKVRTASFTINKISADIFRFTVQAGRAKVQKWLNAGIVEQTGEVPNPGNRPSHLYSVTDPRVAIVMKGNTPFRSLLESVFAVCVNCEEFNVTDTLAPVCTSCQQELTEQSSLLSRVQRIDEPTLI